MAQIKTSIKIKKFWYADVASDGGTGNNWQEVQVGQREATVQFNGTDADTSNYKNVEGNILESSTSKGEMTMNFQLADLTPSVIAEFTGGTVTVSAESKKYDAPENQNQVIEKSIKFLTEKNVLFIMTRASFDGYPIVNDDDLHYYQMNSVILKPEKAGVSSYSMEELLLPDENDITVFSFVEETIPAVITAVSHTVAITVANGTDPSDLVATVEASLGASITPASGITQDFTTPFVYAVESASGTSQDWTVTVTVAV